MFDETVERLGQWLNSLEMKDCQPKKSTDKEKDKDKEVVGKKESLILKLKKKHYDEGVAASRPSGVASGDGGTNKIQKELQNELQVYNKLAEPQEDEPILKFWKTNEALLPLLSNAARRILGVPCASSSVERTFSVASGTVTNLRTSLNPKTVEGMVIQKANGGRVDLKSVEDSEISESETDSETDSENETQVEEAVKSDGGEAAESVAGPSAAESVIELFTMQGTPATPRLPREKGKKKMLAPNQASKAKITSYFAGSGSLGAKNKSERKQSERKQKGYMSFGSSDEEDGGGRESRSRSPVGRDRSRSGARGGGGRRIRLIFVLFYLLLRLLIIILIFLLPRSSSADRRSPSYRGMSPRGRASRSPEAR
jgi:hypothetical protein